MSFKSVFFLVVGTVLFGIVLFVVGAMMMPRHAKVSRSIQIVAPASFIFPYINVPRNFTDWSPWGRYDSKIFYSYEGPRKGKGASIYWASDHEKVGSGSQTITHSVQDKEIKTNLRFGDNTRAQAGFTLSEVGGLTEVTWSFSTDFGADLFQRYSGPFMDKYIGDEYEIGLKNLKEIIEKDYKQSQDTSFSPPESDKLKAPTELLTPLK